MSSAAEAPALEWDPAITAAEPTPAPGVLWMT
jgi:hypothetical protein